MGVMFLATPLNVLHTLYNFLLVIYFRCSDPLPSTFTLNTRKLELYKFGGSLLLNFLVVCGDELKDLVVDMSTWCERDPGLLNLLRDT